MVVAIGGFDMKFYNREEEIRYLNEILKLSKRNSKMIFITGRRRIGKTRLLLEAFKGENYIYLFVSKKDEALLCEEFVSIVEKATGKKPFGKIEKISQLLEFIFEISKERHLILIIDEFQDFYFVNNSVFSDFQRLWDLNKDNSKLLLIFSGSIYTLMKKIFEGRKEPLFGRVSGKIILTPLDIKVLKSIYNDNVKEFNARDFLTFYILTGGVPRYTEIFVDNNAMSFDSMLNLILSSYSFFIDEGKELLIEELGSEYRTYFSILSLIASSKTSRSEIESILGKSVGGYLSVLENEYNIIEKIRPVFSKQNSRLIKYRIIDNFLNFWFRFIYKYRTLVEIKNFSALKEIVKRDFDTFSGILLEKYFGEKLIQSGKYTLIGNYWERGHKNKIDIIAIDEREKRALIADVKLKKDKLDMKLLKKKSEKILVKLKDYRVKYRGFSIDDI